MNRLAALLSLLLAPVASAWTVTRLAVDAGATENVAFSGTMGQAGTNVFFVAGSPSTGTELYVSGGTPGTTQLVADLTPGVNSSFAQSTTVQLVPLGQQIYFVTAAGGLWTSDGTLSGTHQVSANLTVPGALRLAGDHFFATNSQTYPGQLWMSDGTDAGTHAVGTGLQPAVTPLVAAFNPTGPWMTYASGKLYTFDAATTNPTSISSAFSNVTSAVPLGSSVVFVGTTAAQGTELWSTDGNTVTLLQDVTPGTGSGLATISNALVASGSRVFFAGTTAANGTELWVTDGTPAGTRLVKDLEPGAGSSAPDRFYAPPSTPGVVYFAATTAASGTELWRSDGTAVGTVQVADVWPGPGSGLGNSALGQMVEFGTGLYFTAARLDIGGELFVVDGSASGASLAFEIFPGPFSSLPTNLLVHAGRLYFAANSPSGVDPWSSDGTAPGTVRLLDAVSPNSSMLHFQEGLLGAIGNRVLVDFSGYSPAPTGREPWCLSPGGASLDFVADLAPGAAGSFPRWLLSIDGGALISAGTPGALFFTDGTTAGTRQVGALSSATFLGELDGGVYVAGAPGTSDVEPWRLDLAGGDLRQVANINGAGASAPVALGVVRGHVLFTAIDGDAGRELWTTDGVTTQMVLDANPGPGNSTQYGPCAVGDTLYFAGDSPAYGSELWKSDGTAAGTVMVSDIVPLAGSSSPNQLTRLGSLVVFSATTATGSEPWRSDGTAIGTYQLKDIRVGAFSSSPSLFTEFGGRLYFSAFSDAEGTELWSTDGTTAGTRLEVDLEPGVTSSYPSTLVNFAGALWFTATTTAAGKELYRYDGVSIPQLFDQTPGTGSTFASLVSVALTPDGALTVFQPGSFGGTAIYRVTGVPPPTITPMVVGTLDAGIYVSDVTVSFQVVDANGNSFTTAGCDGGAVTVDTPGITFACAATSADGTASTVVTIVRDTTPPTVTCPTGRLVEATSPQGALASYGAATATDAIDPAPAVTFVPASGSWVALGTTQVSVTARDRSGHVSAPCTFSYLVRDTTAPSVTCPASRSVEASSWDGGVSTWPALVATDAVDPSPVVSASAASGSVFALGATTVAVRAVDASGNDGGCSFQVTVVDTTAPALTCPATQTVEAARPDGGQASWPLIVPRDLADPAPALSFSVSPGDWLPLGDTTVTVHATDRSTNQATCSFTVHVGDTTAPALTCPASFVLEATSAYGAKSNTRATAIDAVDLAPTVNATPAADAFYPLGTTTVQVTAVDRSGNSSACSFDVTTVDTTPPAVACPAPVVTAADAGDQVVVTWTGGSATDAVDHPPRISFSPPSGSTFSTGTTTVTMNATDTAGNVGACTFTVTVPCGGAACDAGVPDAGAPDAGLADAGALDAGVVDAGSPDAGSPDAGDVDAGAQDAGAPDAAIADAGAADAGLPDAGSLPADGGVADVAPLYGWSCGCQGAPGTDLALVGLLGLTLLARRRRGSVAVAACLVVLSAGAARAAGPQPVILVPADELSRAVAEALAPQLVEAGVPVKTAGPSSPSVACLAQGDAATQRACVVAAVAPAKARGALVVRAPAARKGAEARYELLETATGACPFDETARGPTATFQKATAAVTHRLVAAAAKLAAFEPAPPATPVEPTPAKPPPPPELPAVAVLDVEVTVPNEKLDAAAFSDQLVATLDQTHAFRVTSTKDAATMLGVERQKQMMGCSEDTSCMAELAQALGANFLFVAGVGRVGDAYVVSARMIDSRRSRVVGRATQQTRSANQLLSTLWRVTQLTLDGYGTQLPPDAAAKWAARPRQDPTLEVEPAPPAGSSGSLGLGVFVGALGAFQPQSPAGRRGSLAVEVGLGYRLTRVDLSVSAALGASPGVRLGVAWAFVEAPLRASVGLRGTVFPTGLSLGGGPFVSLGWPLGNTFGLWAAGGAELFGARSNVESPLVVLLGSAGVEAHF